MRTHEDVSRSPNRFLSPLSLKFYHKNPTVTASSSFQKISESVRFQCFYGAHSESGIVFRKAVDYEAHGNSRISCKRSPPTSTAAGAPKPQYAENRIFRRSSLSLSVFVHFFGKYPPGGCSLRETQPPPAERTPPHGRPEYKRSMQTRQEHQFP